MTCKSENHDSQRKLEENMSSFVMDPERADDKSFYNQR